MRLSRKEHIYVTKYIRDILRCTRSREYAIYKCESDGKDISLTFGDDFYDYDVRLSLEIEKTRADGGRSSQEYKEYNRDNFEDPDLRIPF